MMADTIKPGIDPSFFRRRNSRKMPYKFAVLENFKKLQLRIKWGHNKERGIKRVQQFVILTPRF